MVRTTSLYTLIDQQGIAFDRYKFNDEVLGVYWRSPRLRHPVIVMDASLCPDTSLYRTVLAHELGHHFTASGNTFHAFQYREHIMICRDEWRANAWAADFLIPTCRLMAANKAGLFLPHELAEHFRVAEWLIWCKYESLGRDAGERERFGMLCRDAEWGQAV